MTALLQVKNIFFASVYLCFICLLWIIDRKGLNSAFNSIFFRVSKTNWSQKSISINCLNLLIYLHQKTGIEIQNFFAKNMSSKIVKMSKENTKLVLILKQFDTTSVSDCNLINIIIFNLSPVDFFVRGFWRSIPSVNRIILTVRKCTENVFHLHK